MKIVHISTIHRALDVRIFYKECRSLAQIYSDVHLIINNPPSSAQDGVIFHDLNIQEKQRFKRLFLRLGRAFDQAIKLKPQIFHFHDPELILLGIILKFTGAKVIYDVHEDTPQEAISLNKHRPLEGIIKFIIWNLVEAIAKLTLDAFVCATPTIAQKFPLNKTVTLYNFPLLDELQIINQTGENNTKENYLIYIGGISKIRGIKEIIDTLELLPENLNTKLLLLGEFESQNLQTEIETLKGWKKVEFLGWQSRQIVQHNLAKAKLGFVILHPERSYLDSWPIKLFEYMSAGIPVIASDFPLWRELITKIGCGLLVNPLKPQEIAEAIVYILENPEIAKEMGQKGQNAIANLYNWDGESQKLLNLYKQLENK